MAGFLKAGGQWVVTWTKSAKTMSTSVTWRVAPSATRPMGRPISIHHHSSRYFPGAVDILQFLIVAAKYHLIFSQRDIIKMDGYFRVFFLRRVFGDWPALTNRMATRVDEFIPYAGRARSLICF